MLVFGGLVAQKPNSCASQFDREDSSGRSFFCSAAYVCPVAM